MARDCSFAVILGFCIFQFFHAVSQSGFIFHVISTRVETLIDRFHLMIYQFECTLNEATRVYKLGTYEITKSNAKRVISSPPSSPLQSLFLFNCEPSLIECYRVSHCYIRWCVVNFIAILARGLP